MSIGRKFDTNKDRWDLLPWAEVQDIVEVLTYGSKKYEDYNWMKVRPFKPRYFSALCRHLIAWKLGLKIDESGKTHLAHAACCILYLMWGDKQGDIDGTESNTENYSIHQTHDNNEEVGSELQDSPDKRNSRKKWRLLGFCKKGDEKHRERRAGAKLRKGWFLRRS